MGTPFAPHLLVQVWVGPVTISLYLVVDPSMPPHERAHAFHINKTTLAAQNINTRLQLDALGTQLNFSVQSMAPSTTGSASFMTAGLISQS
jgi:hypothetical protein